MAGEAYLRGPVVWLLCHVGGYAGFASCEGNGSLASSLMERYSCTRDVICKGAYKMFVFKLVSLRGQYISMNGPSRYRLRYRMHIHAQFTLFTAI